MKQTTIEKIKEAVIKSKEFPNAIIEYNFEELPKDKEIKVDNFYGVKAVFNKNISLGKGYNIIYKLS
jgi:hypothetical protein